MTPQRAYDSSPQDEAAYDEDEEILNATQVADFLLAIASHSFFGASQGVVNDILDSGDRVHPTADTIPQLFTMLGRRLHPDGTVPQLPYEEQAACNGTLYVWYDAPAPTPQYAQRFGPRGVVWARDYGHARALYFIAHSEKLRPGQLGLHRP